jgi:hypothetical protein
MNERMNMGRALTVPTHVDLWQALCAPLLGPSHECPALLKKFQIAPRLRPLISSGSREKDPRQICVSAARASHSHKTQAEVSSPAPHFLHKGLSVSPIVWRCLLRVLCPVTRPVTAPDWALLADISVVLAAVRGPEINSWACLRVPTRPLPSYQLLSVQPALNVSSYTLPWDPKGRLRSCKVVNGVLLCEIIGNFVSTYSWTSGDPEESHRISGDVVQRPLALSYQRGRYLLECTSFLHEI